MMTRRQQTSVDEVRPEGLWTKTNNKTVYYADCEKYSFAMSHTYMFPSFMRRFGKGGHYMGPGYSLPGTLYNHDNKPLQKYSAYSERGTSSQREFTAHLPQFSLAQLMSAAGMSTLDEQHDLISESSYRFRGAVLVVELTYSNLAVGKIYPFVERQWGIKVSSFPLTFNSHLFVNRALGSEPSLLLFVGVPFEENTMGDVQVVQC
eukprot:TRINITY_DN67589_c2_g1_i1.p1 TRINITY_DN67589_c2_g1~~TRINITY_DN67589_c2_g1_i1.p1  ORF type:complete len:205 (-),score=30.94 TRINITY_DN67589_c2_g1_i1:533-1147(-)